MKKKLPLGELGFLLAVILCVSYYFFSVKGYGLKAVLWPYFLMVGILLCVAVIALELLRNASAQTEDVSAQEAEPQQTFGEWFRAKSPIFVIIVSFVCYTLLLKTLGLHLCNFLLSFFLVYYLSKGKWKTAIITAACITLAFYLVFDMTLGLRLPKFKLLKMLGLG